MNPMFEALFSVANQGALALLMWSWQGLLLLACVWAGLKLFRVRTPSLRHHIWLFALLALALLPLCPSLPMPQRQAQALTFATALPRYVMTPAVELTTPTQEFPTTITAPERATGSLALVGLLIGWLTGVLYVCFRNARSYVRLRQARRQAQPVSFAALGCVQPAKPAVPLALTAFIRSPILYGIWRPLILLPHDITEWTTVAEREAMLAHECAHLARRDHFTNPLPVALNAVFFFHPLVRYACRQFCLERELACDDHVIHHGADAATYAESLLKAAERSLRQATAFGLHQPAFFTAKQTLERRIEMILNTDRVRVLARQWRYLVLPAALLMALTVALSSSSIIGKSSTNPAPNQAQQDDLVERAVANADAAIRLTAVQRLAEIKGERGTISLLEVYQRSTDERIKESVIRTLAARGEERPLAAIAQVEPSPGLQQLAKQSWSDLLAHKQQTKLDQFTAAGTVPPPPPPPPPPVRASLPHDNYEFQVIGSETHSLLHPLGHSPAQVEGKKGSKLKLPHFNLSATNSNFVVREGAYYFLERFEIELEGAARLYGRGTLRVVPKTDVIEYALSMDGGIYLDPERTQKAGLSEFLK